jgi:AbrB family looped-hinge helix DNA binding protein
MDNPGEAGMPLVKIKDKGQVTLPVKLRERHGLAVGDYVEITEDGSRTVLVPQEVVERHPAIDAAIAEGLTDIRAGRVTPAFANMQEYRAWRKTPEGKKFARS